MKSYRVTCLAGDGIGEEIMACAKQVLSVVSKRFGFEIDWRDFAFGGAGIDYYGEPFAKEVRVAALDCDAVLLGAVGGAKWDKAVVRPEQGLLDLRQALDLFANVRPLRVLGALLTHSPVKAEVVKGTDLVIVRELSAGAYFGQPRFLEKDNALDSITYNRAEIERVVRYGFELAISRRKKLTSVDKANVLATSKLWRQVVEAVAADFPDVMVEHQLVDSMSMMLITRPSDYDVIVTENLFGDILSDEASVLAGSLGVLPSASFNQNGPFLYEPAHGSAPDIAGKGIANPIAMILSAALMLRHSFAEIAAADAIEKAVAELIEKGRLTADLVDDAPLSSLEFTKELINCLTV